MLSERGEVESAGYGGFLGGVAPIGESAKEEQEEERKGEKEKHCKRCLESHGGGGE